MPSVGEFCAKCCELTEIRVKCLCIGEREDSAVIEMCGQLRKMKTIGKKPARQIAALPVRRTRKGKLQVLLVTARGSGRWVVPKGWPMKDKTAWQAAAQEALEEAGAIGEISSKKIGRYRYRKRDGNGRPIICRVSLYPMAVSRLRKKWPERGERRRKWFSPKAAARRVHEKELKALLKGLEDDTRARKVIGDLPEMD